MFYTREAGVPFRFWILGFSGLGFVREIPTIGGPMSRGPGDED